MAETSTKRRREKYSKLICLGCRARRIRCVLPDDTIQPSSEPQPAEKACHRCQQNGLDCVVDFTTLGRPAQKRNRINRANSSEQQNNTSDGANENFEDNITHDVDDYLLSHPETIEDVAPIAKLPKDRPSKKEVSDSMISSFHFLGALLSKDKEFASAIGSQPRVEQSVLELVNDSTAALLDTHLVWHSLYYPDIPSLAALRQEIKSTEIREPERATHQFLFALLCDLALDVPTNRLASFRHLHPAVKAMTYHYGQKVLFTLSRSRYTLLALSLASQYRPLILTSSQAAAPHTLKALPYIVLGKYIATEMGYRSAGARLTRALNDFSADPGEIKSLMHECLHFIQLNIVEDLQDGPFNEWTRRVDPSALECLEALHTAVLLNQMPSGIILPYVSISCWTQMLANLRDMTENWKDLGHLAEVIQGHKVFCDREREVLDRLLDQFEGSQELSSVISHLADMERHLSHTIVVGTALFFAVMFGAFGQTHQGAIQSEQAMQVSENIIEQLLSHEKDDPSRPSHRRFLEQYGESRMDDLERCLTNFITAADTLTLNGIPYVGPSRDTVGWMIMMCKDVVEGNAARLKGWGGLHDRVDVQMILFLECARKLEGMSANAGSLDALSNGCILTVAAKLLRSLHRILQGFKTTVATAQRRSASASTKSDPTPPSLPDDMPTLSNSVTTASSDWENVTADDLFTDWENWPQFDAFDFTDLFGSDFNFDLTSI